MTRIAELRRHFDVEVTERTIAGVRCYEVTPKTTPAKNRNRLLVNIHGGAYVFGPGEAGTLEAITMAGFSQMKVISIDYRMPPDFPYPAAMDDAMAVWKELVKLVNPRRIGLFGTSTGGGMTLAMVQRAKAEGLPLPAAIAPGTPWSDLSKTGDTYFTSESLDNALGGYEPLLSAAAKLYANGIDLKDPRLSPVYGNFAGFPPTILTTRHAGSVLVEHRARPSQAPCRRCGSFAGSLRRAVTRSIHPRSGGARDEGSVRGDHEVLRPAPCALMHRLA